ncbi:NAD(P)H-dependent oxidoreductase [Pontibacter sp. G13]|uniref:NADPH-dependent FMN reductase n=1 Tax=Pontibacter sp. G13 TaxID=3074898 RepID=UPI00288C0591|nr:NAD(P)H-dependent oxidoreductase [Pontibacter sp. G13]WNJ20487.1 NAD(P)H-dependent oxidoreductase [Pontibacter sp. G13]
MSTLSDLKIAVLYGSYRHHRQGIRAAQFAVNRLANRCKAFLIDAKSYSVPMLDKMFKEYPAGSAPQNLQKISDHLMEADGFVICTGEYNHSLPPGLKNLLDHFQKEYFFKPAGIMSYSMGGFGGARASVHARVVVGELGMASISRMMQVSHVHDAIDESGRPWDDKIGPRFDKFSDELLWYASALKEARQERTPY